MSIEASIPLNLNEMQKLNLCVSMLSAREKISSDIFPYKCVQACIWERGNQLLS